ncbi:MAG: nucleotide sugar dehydrogenase [Candidatus Xenobiia bacterium LiM19]
MQSSNQNTYDICVVGGLGHVGLPLALLFADAGKKVVAYDINTKTIETVLAGKIPFQERGAEEVLGRVLGRTFFASPDRSVIAESRYVIVVIGTPVDEHLNPKFTLFRRFFDEILDLIRDDHHIVLRSTIYPGSTEKIKKYLESKGRKMRISFCPERIAQGFAMEEIRALPQIISAFDPESMEEARELFKPITQEIIELTPIEAELGKLFTNVWRYLQFATSNQFYLIALENNTDFYKIYRAITQDYPRIKGMPSAGFAAGPCLFKDTMQLASFSNNTFFLGHSAMLINEGLPNFLVVRLKNKYPLKYMTVGILGMAFKANNDDTRESLSYKLRKILEIEAKEVLCTDVYIKDESFVEPEELIKRSDIVILATPHSEYRSLEIPSDKVLVDIWDFFGKGGLF